MNRFPRRARAPRALAICGLVAAAALTGCGAGQLSQTASIEPAVNGASATVNHIALRDIRIRAIQTSDALQPGKTVDLLFVATNQSSDINDSLVSITSDFGSVSVTGNREIPAGGALIVGTPEAGTPEGDASALSATEGARTATATVTLSKPITNGLSYNFTFRFAHAGETTVPVPITAGTNAPRLDQVPGSSGAQGGAQGGHP
ncbi:hypothetical protein [Mycobacterium sp.]|uniref:hypothetical protein n=1 Tax=Mycobacterium sp. TaxID=1785 RepID=UPI002D6411D9|nr:hypothetical protein [Mycobacterium sp.]HZA11943.1 hypothetical protein [Mycobacterium sp.]